MNIIFINPMTDTFTPTNSFSTSTWVWELGRCATEEGFKPLVIASRDRGHAAYDWPWLILIDPPQKPKTWLGTKLQNQYRHRFGWSLPGQAGWVGRVIKAVEKHAESGVPMILSNEPELAVCLRERFPRAVIIHQMHGENGTRERFRRKFRKAVSAACAVSDATRRWNENYYGFEPDEMVTVLNGVDLEKFRPADPPVTGIPVISCHGRLDPTKGADVLLKAAICVKRSLPAASFKIQLVGRKFHHDQPMDDFDRLLASLEKDLLALGVTVERTGWIDRNKMPEVLRQAQINLVCSRWNEPSALTIYEGMASGLATIGSRTGGTPEIIADGGLLFDNEDVEGLAAHLQHLITSPQTLSEYQRRARQRAEELPWHKAWEQIRGLAFPESLRNGRLVSAQAEVEHV